MISKRRNHSLNSKYVKLFTQESQEQIVGSITTNHHCLDKTGTVHYDWLKCLLCSEILPSSGTLHYHLATAHTGVNITPHLCLVCLQEFWSASQLECHLGVHHSIDDPATACVVCGIQLATQEEQHAHMEEHPAVHHCPACSLKFSSQQQMMVHIQQYHLHQLQPHSCSLCPRRFRESGTLKVHMRRHVAQVCPEAGCHHLAQDESWMVVHLYHHHQHYQTFVTQQDAMDYLLDWLLSHYFSRDVYTRQSSVSQESQLLDESSSEPHTGPPVSPEKPVTAHNSSENLGIEQEEDEVMSVLSDVVETVVQMDEEVKEHPGQLWRINGKIGPLLQRCGVCNRYLSSSIDLATYKHQLTELYPGLNHHQCQVYDQNFPSMTQLDTLSCPYCLQKYSYKSHLKVHLRTHTGEKPYVCEKCGKSFKRLQQCKVHQSITHSEYGDECVECGRTFTDKTNLLRHRLLVHHHLKRWVCGVCAQTFSYSQDLRKHLDKKHNISFQRLDAFTKKSRHEVYVVPEGGAPGINEAMRRAVENVSESERQKVELVLASTNNLLKDANITNESRQDPSHAHGGQMIQDYKNIASPLIFGGGESEVPTVTRIPCVECGKQTSLSSEKCKLCMAADRQLVSINNSSDNGSQHQVVFQCSVCGVHYGSQSQCVTHVTEAHSSLLAPLQEDTLSLTQSTVMLPSSLILTSQTSPHCVMQASQQVHQDLPPAPPVKTDINCGRVVFQCSNSGIVSSVVTQMVLSSPIRTMSCIGEEESVCTITLNQEVGKEGSLTATPSYTTSATFNTSLVQGVSVVSPLVPSTSLSQSIPPPPPQLPTHYEICNDDQTTAITTTTITTTTITTSCATSAATIDMTTSNTSVANVLLELAQPSHILPASKDNSIMESSGQEEFTPTAGSTVHARHEGWSLLQQEKKYDCETAKTCGPFQEVNVEIMQQRPSRVSRNVSSNSASSSFTSGCPPRNYSLTSHSKKKRVTGTKRKVKTAEEKAATAAAASGSELKVTYKCDVCSKTLKSAVQLKKHQRTHEAQRHLCEICNKAFTEKYNLKTHMLTHTLERPHECPKCLKTFRYMRDLTEHKRTHEGAKPHACQVCNKSFVRRRDYTRHYKEQHSEVRYECQVCGAAFKRRIYLDSVHMRTHHSYPQIQSHQSSTQQSNHEQQNHQQQEEQDQQHQQESIQLQSPECNPNSTNQEKKEEVHICCICGRTFARARYLTAHLKTHSRRANYVRCPQCPRMFVSEETLEVHRNAFHAWDVQRTLR